MTLSRRDFLLATAASAAWPLMAHARQAPAATLFQHGVASGDPLTDRVVLWTRVTAPPTRSATGPIDVQWSIAEDERLAQVVARGTTAAAAERDFTVKVDAGSLRPGRTYYYAFEAGGERSPVGRTRTLPDGTVQRLRIASLSCSNYPAGYFNVYRCVANRPDIDVVLHLGDYIYEFANGVYGDGSATGRVPATPGEAITLQDYRTRYATYRSDVDLQEVHRMHPFIVVWDDHETANNSWSGGAGNHDAAEGDWQARRAAAYRAYLEWLPIRESNASGIRLYRSFRFGDLADLVMLDTRTWRDRQPPVGDPAAIADPQRNMLGSEQEAWLFDELRASQRGGSSWRLIGQQILFTAVTPPGIRIQSADMWEGYPVARGRVLDMLGAEKIKDVAILTGDLHSSWALETARSPWGKGDVTTPLAVEMVTPAISSPPLFTTAAIRDRAPMLRLAAQHVKYLDGERHGYVLVDLTPKQLRAEWNFVPTVTQRTAEESTGIALVCERGSSRFALA